MGLLGNVAEVSHHRHRHHRHHHNSQHHRDNHLLDQVPELRHKLMTREFVEEFAFLLDSYSDGIEVGFSSQIRISQLFQVSYNAAGVLAHMASDGPEAWTVRQPERSRP